MRSPELEESRIYNVASRYLLYLLVFRNRMHDELIKKTDNWRCEEALENICKTLREMDRDYNALLNFMRREADGEPYSLGTNSRRFLKRKELAAQIVRDLESLKKPIIITYSGLPDVF